MNPPMFTNTMSGEELARITDRGIPLTISPVYPPQFTLRAHIAAMAMQGIIIGCRDDGAEVVWPMVAQHAVQAADALIAELKKPRET